MRGCRNRRRHALRVSRVLRVMAGTAERHRVRFRQSASSTIHFGSGGPWADHRGETYYEGSCLGRSLGGGAVPVSRIGTDEGGSRPQRLFAPRRSRARSLRVRTVDAAANAGSSAAATVSGGDGSGRRGGFFLRDRPISRWERGLTGGNCASGSGSDFSVAFWRSRQRLRGVDAPRSGASVVTGEVVPPSSASSSGSRLPAR